MQAAPRSQVGFVWHLLRVAIVVVVCAGMDAPSAANGQDATANESTEAGAEDAEATLKEGKPAEEKMRPMLDLGKFKINDLRPTRNETAKLTFSMHLVFSDTMTKQQLAELEQWKHRLRDQVITAVRISYIKDFQEPDLSRLRKHMLIRANRLFKQKLAEEVLLTEYLFRTH